MTDTISISDRMSSASPSITSLNQLGLAANASLNRRSQSGVDGHANPKTGVGPGHSNPRATTISTIAVQCLECRIVVALLQSRDILTLRVLESAPSFHTIGASADEAEAMSREHMNVLTKLQNIESPVEELLRRVDASLVKNPNPEIYIAMAESLGQAWKDLNGMLDRRRELLELGAKFHTTHKACLAKLTNVGDVESVGRRETLKMYSEANELGKEILEQMSPIEDSALSMAQVKSMLEELWVKLSAWKQELQIKQNSAHEENLFESLVHELDDIVNISDKNPEAARRRLLLLISRLEEIEFGDKSKVEALIAKCYEQLDKLNQKLEQELSLNQFLLDNKQLHEDSFKAEHEKRLRELEEANSGTGTDPDRKELIDIIKTRLNMRNEYEYLLENVMSFPSDAEIHERLSAGLPAAGGLEIDGALLILKEKREQLENDLYYRFKPQIDGIEQCLYDIGELGTLKSLLEKTYQIQADLAHAPKFNGKEDLDSARDTLMHQLEAKINALHSVHQFLFENRELTQSDFQRLHEEELLKVVYELHHHELESRFHVRLGLRQMYDEMLQVPLEYDEEQVEHLLREDPTLDIRQALENYRHARRIDELLATLEFPLPENLATAKNDLEDFKSFEAIVQSLPNPTEELIDKSKTKKKNILKCIELYEILERVERYEYITRIEQLEMELFGSSTYAEAIQDEHRRAAQEIEIAPPIPPPPAEEALYSKVDADERDHTKSPSPALSFIAMPVPILSRPKSTSIETQTELAYEQPQPQPYPPQSPPPLINPFQAAAFVQQTEHLITEILDRREQQLARSRTPLHEMETQTFEPQPIELSNEETQTTMLLLLPPPTISDEGCQTDEVPDYDFIPYSPPAVFSPPPTPGIETETQTSAQFMRAAETQTFTYQVLANRQTQTPVEFIKALIPPVPPPKPKYLSNTETQTSPAPPEPVPIAEVVVERCEMDTQTVECPRFLTHMETQTWEDEQLGVGLGLSSEPSVMTTTTEQVHTYYHERIEQVPASEIGRVHDRGSQSGSFQQRQEVETQTTVAIPIIETSPSSSLILPQSPQIAKIFSNTESQTDIIVSSAPTPMVHETEAQFKPSEQQVLPDQNQQSTTVFADFRPQVVNLEFEVTSTATARAQEICLASEEVCEKALYEGPLLAPASPTHEPGPAPVAPASTPVPPVDIDERETIKQFTATPYQPPPSQETISKPVEPQPQIKPEELPRPARQEIIGIPITIEKTTPAPAPIRKPPTSQASAPDQLEADAVRERERAPIIVSEKYETKSSIFEQSYVLESTSGVPVEEMGLDPAMMDKGSGTPLSKVSDRVKAWEFYQHEPEPVFGHKPVPPPKPTGTTTTTTCNKDLRPSSISEYRLLFQSPSPTNLDAEPSADTGSINEFCKRFESSESESVSKLTSTSTTVPPSTQKPAIPEKPKRVSIPKTAPSTTATSSRWQAFEPFEPPSAPTYRFPAETGLIKTSQSSTATTLTKTHTKIQEMVRPSKFVPVTAGEWSEQSDYESDLEAYKIPPMWVPPSQRDAPATKSNVITPIPIVRTSAFTSVQERTGPKPVPPPKPSLSPIPSTAIEKRSAFEKPAIAPKPQIPSPKPGSAMTMLKSASPTPIVVPLPYESKQTSMTSTLTKTEETKFLLRPIKSPEPVDVDPDLKVTRRLTQSPEYFVSITAPPITATTTAIQQSKDGQTVRKIYETTSSSHSSSMTTTKRIVEQEEIGGGTAASPDMEPYYNWREATVTSPFYPLHEQPGFYSSREETPIPRKSVETVIPIEREGDGKSGPANVSTIIKPEPILKSVEGVRFIPSKFIPALTTDEEGGSTTEDDDLEFRVRPKWRPTGILYGRNSQHEPKYKPVRGPPVRSVRREPGFYLACDFSCEYGVVPTAAFARNSSGEFTNTLEIVFPAATASTAQIIPIQHQHQHGGRSEPVAASAAGPKRK